MRFYINEILYTCVQTRYDNLPLNLEGRGVEIQVADYLVAVAVLLLSLHSSSVPEQLQVVRGNWSMMDSAALDIMAVVHVSWSGVFEYYYVVLWHF